jgi:serine phosphatase RsbU (regulator of sigma subunit)/anti-sigma regulatory factor (Ser/Thr protein kinase)
VAQPTAQARTASAGAAAAWCWWAGFVAAALWTEHFSLVAGAVVAPVIGSAVATVRTTALLAGAAVVADVVAGTALGWTPLLVPLVVVATTAAGSVAAVATAVVRAADAEALGVARRTSQRERRRRRAVETRSRLYRLAAALATASTVEDVAQTTFDALVEEVGASAGLLGVLEGGLDDAESRVRMRHAFGYRADVLERWPAAPLTPDMPATEAMVSGIPLFAERADQFAGLWPAVGADVRRAGFGALCVLPLLVSARPTGFLAVSWSAPRTFDDEDRRALQALADQCAQALERARLAEEERRARRRLAFLGEVTRIVSASLDAADVARRVSEMVVDAMADGCAVLVPDDAGQLRPLASVSRSRAAVAALERAGADERAGSEEGGAVAGEAGHEEGGAAGAARAASGAHASTEEGAAPSERTGRDPSSAAQVVVVPLVAAGRQLGSMVVVSGLDSPPLDAQDESLVAEVAARTSTALDNANRYERERHTASVLQRAALPDHLPTVPGARFDAIYRAGTAGTEVGGDWYDVVPLPDGRALVSVGDVMGKGAAAAALMSQARTAIRAYGVLDPRPALVLDRIDQLMATFGETRLVSAVVAVLDPDAGQVVLAAAGHPPPLVVGTGGCRLVETGRRRILGLPSLLDGAGAGEAATEEATVTLGPGELLVLYSDGLVERRGESLADGLDRLRAAAAELAAEPGWADAPAQRLVDAMLSASETADDVAVLAVGFVPAPHPAGARSEVGGGAGADPQGERGDDGRARATGPAPAVGGATGPTPAGRPATSAEQLPALVGDGQAVWIILPPEPTSAGAARQWVTGRLAAWAAGRPATGAAAQAAGGRREVGEEPLAWAALLTSEVVTNAVLHARTDIGVGVRIDGDVLHVEVCDQSTSAPVPKQFGPRAATGRGLVLVERLATAWGVEDREAGKVVWFELALADRSPRHPRDDSRRGGHIGTGADPVAGRRQPGTPIPGPRPGAPGTGRQPATDLVRLLGVPATLAVDTAAHYDGLARELQVRSAQREAAGSVAAQRTWSWRQVARIGGVASSFLQPVTEGCLTAMAAGQEQVDLDLAAPLTAAAACRELNEVLDEIEDWCRQGWMLTVASAPIVAFRRWLLGEVAAQADGAPPRPWSEAAAALVGDHRGNVAAAGSPQRAAGPQTAARAAASRGLSPPGGRRDAE